MCFQALGGCLRPTPDSKSLSKDPKWVFGMCGIKLAVKKNIYVFILLILVLTSRSTQWGSLLRWGKAVVGLRQSIRAKKHFRYASFFGCLRVIVVDLGALEDKFVANSVPKTAEKTQLLWQWMPVQTALLLPFFLDDPVLLADFGNFCQLLISFCNFAKFKHLFATLINFWPFWQLLATVMNFLSH